MSLTFSEEDPHIHWPNICVKDRVVLDLGAGDFGRIGSLPHMTTPDYWLANGATRVIAVDASQEDSQKYTHKKIEYVQTTISGPDDIEALMLKHKPDVIKSDIEGYEKFFLYVSPSILVTPRAYAIETHNEITLNAILSMLRSLGYGINWIMKHEIEHYVSVLYAERLY